MNDARMIGMSGFHTKEQYYKACYEETELELRKVYKWLRFWQNTAIGLIAALMLTYLGLAGLAVSPQLEVPRCGC